MSCTAGRCCASSATKRRSGSSCIFAGGFTNTISRGRCRSLPSARTPWRSGRTTSGRKSRSGRSRRGRAPSRSITETQPGWNTCSTCRTRWGRKKPCRSIGRSIRPGRIWGSSWRAFWMRPSKTRRGNPPIWRRGFCPISSPAASAGMCARSRSIINNFAGWKPLKNAGRRYSPCRAWRCEP